MFYTDAQKADIIRQTPAHLRALDALEAAIERIDNKISAASARGIRWQQGSLTAWPQIRSLVAAQQQGASNWMRSLTDAYRAAARDGRVERRPDVGLGIATAVLVAIVVIISVVAVVAGYVRIADVAEHLAHKERMTALQSQINVFERAVDQQMRNPNPTPPPPIQLPQFPGTPPAPQDREPTPGEQVQKAAGGLGFLALALGALFLVTKLTPSRRS